MVESKVRPIADGADVVDHLSGADGACFHAEAAQRLLLQMIQPDGGPRIGVASLLGRASFAIELASSLGGRSV